MKKEKAGTCPGCHRHCAENACRCKYGRAYFLKKKEKEREEIRRDGCGERTKAAHKWERHVETGGTAWKLLSVSRRIKKALCGGRMSEEMLMGALTEAEKQTLSKILDRLACGMEENQENR